MHSYVKTHAFFLHCFSAVERISGHKLSLTILNVSGLQRHDYCRRLFCTVMLGQNRKCRTPSVEGKNTASWNFTVSVLGAEFSYLIGQLKFPRELCHS